MQRKILITGGLGFIGSHLVRHWTDKYPDDHIMILDAMTYAADKSRLDSVRQGANYEISVTDLRDQAAVSHLLQEWHPDHVIHLAAESHVCRSLEGPKDFFHTNMLGTWNLIEEFKRLQTRGRFLHISTDEVYGELPLDPSIKFKESTRYEPRSPYAASKTGSNHIVDSYYHSYGIDTVVTCCSNNFGPNQHEEKLIPRTIKRLLEAKAITLYKPGTQVRDWIYVNDHCRALDLVFHKGVSGETYNVGGENEKTNLDVVKDVIRHFTGFVKETPLAGIELTDGRPTDDLRYAIDCSKLIALGYDSRPDLFQVNLMSTVAWYLERWTNLGEAPAQ